MFTGIVQSLKKVTALKPLAGGGQTFAIDLHTPSIPLGNSISINGVCQTVVRQDDFGVWFESIEETLAKTNLKSLSIGDYVNCEHAARFGDEIGGHLLSGHIVCETPLKKIIHNQFYFEIPEKWRKYLFEKGYVALDGVSLTIAYIDRSTGELCVHLIPETLKRTTFGFKKEGSWFNLEIDAITQAVVDRVDELNGLGRVVN